MEEIKIKRPLSVWITQILHLLFAILLMWGLALSILLAGGLDFVFLLIILFNLAAIGLCVVSFWGLAKRKPFARWLGIVVLLLNCCFIALTIFTIGVPIVIFLPAFCAFIFLIYRLTFGSAANEFFAKPSSGE